LNDFDKVNEELQQMTQEKKFLQSKITEILRKSGYDVSDYKLEENNSDLMKVKIDYSDQKLLWSNPSVN
jgi:predicted GNAT superfamily acetyltransferase